MVAHMPALNKHNYNNFPLPCRFIINKITSFAIVLFC